MNPQQKTRSVFSIQRIDLEKFISGKPYWHDKHEVRRQYEEELNALPPGTRIEFVVGHFRPSIQDVDWLPRHLLYCVAGPDRRINAEWVRLIETGEE